MAATFHSSSRQFIIGRHRQSWSMLLLLLLLLCHTVKTTSDNTTTDQRTNRSDQDVSSLTTQSVSDEAGSSQVQKTEVEPGQGYSYIKELNSPNPAPGVERPWKPALNMNTAWLTINNTLEEDVHICSQSQECYRCPLMFIVTIEKHGAQTILVNATHQTDLRIFLGSSMEPLCGLNETFQEGGDYWLFPSNGSHSAQEWGDCLQFSLVNDPDNAKLPILYVALGLIGVAVAYISWKKLFFYFRRAALRKKDSMDVSGPVSEQDGGDVMHMNGGLAVKDGHAEESKLPVAEKAAKKPRLKSLDTFRGLTLALMIFVNYNPGEYWFFEHARWNGLNLADLVFPWFVFIMGVSMNFSFRSMFRQGWGVPKIIWKVVWRAAKLFLIGFILGTHYEVPDMSKVRILGVLQRLALTYLISALIHFSCTRRSDSHQDRGWGNIRDLVLYIPEWVVNLCVLALHTGLVYALPVPGCPTGYVGPGGLGDFGQHENCTGGATGYVDSVILGYDHMYAHPEPKILYQTVRPFDPEGILGTLNCVFLCFLGIQCGRIILLYQDHRHRLVRFLIWAIVLGALGALLTKCSRDEGWVPANKNIWSVSFSLITASLGFILLSGIYLVTDLFTVWHGQPFIYPGMNSIVIYGLHHIFAFSFPVSFLVDHVHWKVLLRSVWGTACWIIVAYWLYVKKIFIAL